MRVKPWSGAKLFPACEAKHGIHTRNPHRWREDSPGLDEQAQVCKMVIQVSVTNNVTMAFNATFLRELKVRA